MQAVGHIEMLKAGPWTICNRLQQLILTAFSLLLMLDNIAYLVTWNKNQTIVTCESLSHFIWNL